MVPRGLRPTRRDIASAFHLFVTPALERIIVEMTNLHGARKYGDGWRPMDATDLRAYVGLLILAGVYRSRGEAAASLWDAESGRTVFRATMPLKVFHRYSRLLRFDDRQSRPARPATDKLAAIREDLGSDVTVDEQLVPFRGTVLVLVLAHAHMCLYVYTERQCCRSSGTSSGCSSAGSVCNTKVGPWPP